MGPKVRAGPLCEVGPIFEVPYAPVARMAEDAPDTAVRMIVVHNETVSGPPRAGVVASADRTHSALAGEDAVVLFKRDAITRQVVATPLLPEPLDPSGPLVVGPAADDAPAMASVAVLGVRVEVTDRLRYSALPAALISHGALYQTGLTGGSED